jgi:hypothetical protein
VKPISFLVFLFFLFSASLCAQTADTTKKDSLLVIKTPADSVKPADTVKVVTVTKPVFQLKNKLLNIDGAPVSLAATIKKGRSNDAFFYLLAIVILLLAFLKRSKAKSSPKPELKI